MEEEFKPIICVICLNVKRYENSRAVDESIKNALDVLLLKQHVEEAINSMVCNACCTKVLEAFQFKTACMDTENHIFPQLGTTNEAPVDSKEIYLMEKGNDQLSNILEGKRICRLCMQIVTSGLTPVKDLEMDIIRRYIPEVDFNATEGPVLCTTCLESLKKHSGFLKNCLSIQKFENVSEDQPMEGQFHIKTEEIEIKSEESIEDTEIFSPANEPTVCKTNDEDSLKNRVFKTGHHKCSSSDHQSKKKSNSVHHQQTYKTFPEVPTYKCDLCHYLTNRKGHLESHQLIHKDISEVQMYKCDICSFTTKYKGNLVKHAVIHKGNSEVLMYRCDLCCYETKFKCRLVNHHLIHKDISEMQLYKCDTCNFETKHRKNLIRHMLVHRNIDVQKDRDMSEVQMYKCDSCNFETKHRKNLVRHLLKHRNIDVQMDRDMSEVQMFKCDSCSFETKYKNSLKRHAATQKPQCATLWCR